MIRIMFSLRIDTLKTIFFLACVLPGLATTSFARAAAGPPFFGVWSCTMVNDGNTVNVADWWQERFDDTGVLTAGAQHPTKLSVRLLRPGFYELTYADGGKAKIEMKEPWIFLRHTQEHRYLCLRQS